MTPAASFALGVIWPNNGDTYAQSEPAKSNKKARMAAPPQTVIPQSSMEVSANAHIEKPSAHGGSWHSAETFNRSLMWQRIYVRRLHDLHYCRDKFHAIAGIIIFTCELQQNIIPIATRTSEGFTSFRRCYPTLMKVRETLTNSIMSTDDADVILAYHAISA